MSPYGTIRRLALSAMLLAGAVAVGPLHPAGAAADVTPPTVAFNARLAVVGTVLSDSTTTPTVMLTTSWTQKDPSGICVEAGWLYEYALAAWVSVPLSLGQTSFDYRYRLGTSRQFSVYLRDCAGNGAYYYQYGPYTSLVQETAATYSAGWTTSKGAIWSGGAVLKNTTVGAKATYRFTGTSVALVSDNAPARGSAKILIDGVQVATINCKSATKSNRVIMFTSRLLPGGSHTLDVVLTGGRIDIDAFLTMQ